MHEWREHAACIGAPPDWFDEDALEHVQTIAVQVYCRRCPVVKACLTDANEVPSAGVRGGLTAFARKARLKHTERDDLLFALYDRGLSDPEMAAHSNCSSSMVWSWRKRNGLAPNYKHGTHPQRKVASGSR